MMKRTHFWILALCALFLLCRPGGATAGVPVPIPGEAPIPLQRLRVNNAAVLPLAGTWRFLLTHGQIVAGEFTSAGHGPTSASSSQDGHPPEDALDGIRTGSNWCAENGDFPQWWQVDLGKPEDVRALAITWEFRNATYRFKVEGSPDGRQWKPLADATAEPGLRDGPVPITPGTIRHLRVTVVGASRPNGAAWAAIRKAQITVRRDGQDVAWTPKVEPEDVVKRDAFLRTDYDDSAWATIPVPANWEMEGFSRPTYDGPDDAVGLYRRWVEIPAGFAGKRVLWHFDGVNNGVEIVINGKRVGYHESGFTAFDIDVTDALRPGERNLLALRVSKRTPSVDLDTGDFWCLGGIYRENYLVALPPTHLQDVTITTDLDARYRDARLKAAVKVAGAPGTAVALQGSLMESGGRVVPGVAVQGEAQIGAEGTALLTLDAPVAAPKLWSAEKPTLYFLLLTLKVGAKTVEHVEERFGFRKIEIRQGVVLWNGVPIKCTGSCRHEEWAKYGHAMTEETWRTDLTLMKGCNINAIRTSHYNHAARFLELCDEMGFYVLDEVPFCWCDTRDPKLEPAFLQRAQETLARDKNRPCVLAWSMGNENPYGPNAEAAFDYMKAHDGTRPAFISLCGPWNNPKLDFADTHYPSLNEVKRIAADKLRATTPEVMTEQPHIFYVSDAIDYDYGCQDFWGQTLVNNWNIVWATDSILGAFIWEWQDQGIADKYPDRNDVDPITGLRGNNNKGIVDGFRHVKPEYWNVKMVYSPVTTAAREVAVVEGHTTVPLQNRYSFTDLSELTCRWQNLAGGKALAQGESHIDCAPRARIEATFPVTAGTDTLRLEFVHPDGRSLYVTRLHVKGAPLPAAPAALPADGKAQVQGTRQEVRAEVAGTELVLDTQTGRFRSWKINGQNMLRDGLILNLGEQRVTHGEHDARNYLASKQPPILKNVKVTTTPRGAFDPRTGAPIGLSLTGDVYLAESPELKAKFACTLGWHADAELDVTWQLTWEAAEANAWELGMKFLLPSDMDQLSWARTGLWTEYPTDHIGATEGTVSSKNASFRSTKRDVYWAELFGKEDYGLAAFPSDTPLHVRARTEKEGVLLFLSSAVAPPRDFSTNLVSDLEIHLKPGQTYTGSFHLRVTKAK